MFGYHIRFYHYLGSQIKIRQHLQIWNNNISMSSRGKTIQPFKEQFIFEKYLNIIPERFRKLIIKFRTSNHYLPLETGR